MIESITTATAKLEMERGKKLTVKTSVSHMENNTQPKKKKKKVPEQDACPVSPRDSSSNSSSMARVVCEDCGRALATTYNLRRHMKNVHNRTLPPVSSQTTSNVIQMEHFDSAPFDHSIPQLHIADDEEQFPLLDESFLNPPLLSPPKSQSLEKLSDCGSLAQTSGNSLLNDMGTSSSNLPLNSSLDCTDSVIGTAVVPKVEPPEPSFTNEQLIFSDLCPSIAQSSSEDSITKENPILHSNVFENQCDNSTEQFLKDDVSYKQNSEDETIIRVKDEPIDDVQPQMEETLTGSTSKSTDLLSLDQWMTPHMSDMDIFGSKPDLVYDLLGADIKSNVNSLAQQCSIESYKPPPDLSRFEAINEKSARSQSASEKHKTKGSRSMVQIDMSKKECDNTDSTGDEPALFRELFENETGCGLEIPKCQSSELSMPSKSNMQPNNHDYISAAYESNVDNAALSFHSGLYETKDSTTGYSVDSADTLYPSQIMACTKLSQADPAAEVLIDRNSIGDSVEKMEDTIRAVGGLVENVPHSLQHDFGMYIPVCAPIKSETGGVAEGVAYLNTSNIVSNVQENIVTLPYSAQDVDVTCSINMDSLSTMESLELENAVNCQVQDYFKTAIDENRNVAQNQSEPKHEDPKCKLADLKLITEKINLEVIQPGPAITCNSKANLPAFDSQLMTADIQKLLEEIIAAVSLSQPLKVPVAKPTVRTAAKSKLCSITDVNKMIRECEKKMNRSKSSPHFQFSELQVVLKKYRDPVNNPVKQNHAFQSHTASQCVSKSTVASEIKHETGSVSFSRVQADNKSQNELLHPAAKSDTHKRAISLVQSTNSSTEVERVLHRILDAVVGDERPVPSRNRKRSFPRIVMEPRLTKRPMDLELNSPSTSDTVPKDTHERRDCLNNQLHAVQNQSAILSSVNVENFNSSQSAHHNSPSYLENNVVYKRKDTDVDRNDVDTNCCMKSCIEPSADFERTLLDYCEESSVPDLIKVKTEPLSNVEDLGCTVFGSKSHTDQAVAVRESSRIRDSKSHVKRQCPCCTESVPSPSVVRKCRMNSGSSNGSNGNSAISPVVPLVPIKTVSSKRTIVTHMKKKRKSNVLTKINTRSKFGKPRTRSTTVP